MVFPVVMCESWTVKKAERQRIDAFELWCWRRLLRVPWTARRSDQSILREISPGISLDGMMLKLKLQYFGQELTHEVAKVLELQLQNHSIQRNPRADLLQNGQVGSHGSPWDSQESSPTTQLKSINSSALSLLHSPTLTSIHDHRKNHSLD